MLSLIKMHISLFKFLNIELRKKRTPIELKEFYRVVAKQYVVGIKQEIKKVTGIFDPEMKKLKIQQKKVQQARKDLYSAYRLVQYMIKAGKTRVERKQIRRDFEKDGRISKEFEKEILKELYGIEEELNRKVGQ
jgi:ubiquinone/menaquinone biosynthesis C-methylase UbiE